MIVKAYYSGGRIDVFDTDRMTDGIPQTGNLLTNYTFDLADVNCESLWLCSYYYEAAEAYKEDPGPKGLPVARRRDGWSFLIADADDLQRLNRVTVDGETVLIQIAGELVDAASLTWTYEAVEVVLPKASIAYRFKMQREHGSPHGGPETDFPEALTNLLDFDIGQAGAEDANRF